MWAWSSKCLIFRKTGGRLVLSLYVIVIVQWNTSELVKTSHSSALQRIPRHLCKNPKRTVDKNPRIPNSTALKVGSLNSNGCIFFKNDPKPWDFTVFDTCSPPASPRTREPSVSTHPRSDEPTFSSRSGNTSDSAPSGVNHGYYQQ